MPEKKQRLMAFRFWVDDWEGGTSMMTNEEAGAYLRLLVYQFRNESIPEVIFKRICGNSFIEDLLKPKFEFVAGFYKQHRMVETRNDAINFRQKQSNAGKKSAEAKLLKINHGSTMVNENINHGSTTVQPLGSGSGSIKEEDNKGGMGEKEGEEKKLLQSDSEKYYQQSIDDQEWLIAVYRSTKIEPHELPPIITQFNVDVIARQEYHETLSRWRSHCVSWIKKQPKQQSDAKPKKNRKHVSSVPVE